jgi:hypothetical protein
VALMLPCTTNRSEFASFFMLSPSTCAAILLYGVSNSHCRRETSRPSRRQHIRRSP